VEVSVRYRNGTGTQWVKVDASARGTMEAGTLAEVLDVAAARLRLEVPGYGRDA
jgi:hypothetical protein